MIHPRFDPDYVWSCISAGGAVAVYFLLFEQIVTPLNPDPALLDALTPEFPWTSEKPAEAAKATAAAVAARYAFVLPSVLVVIAALAALATSIFAVLPHYGPAAQRLGIGAAVGGGVLGHLYQHSNTLRSVVADCPPVPGVALEALTCPLNVAARQTGDLGFPITAEHVAHLSMTVDISATLATAALLASAVSFFFIARSARNDAELSVRELRTRRRTLAVTLAAGGVLLAVAVATTHGFYHIAASMMTEAAAKPFLSLASSGAGYWGAIYSTLLVTLALPAILSLQRDGERAARHVKGEDDLEAQRKWREAEGLTFRFNEKLGSSLAALAPLLTAPALDLLNRAVTAIPAVT